MVKGFLIEDLGCVLDEDQLVQFYQLVLILMAAEINHMIIYVKKTEYNKKAVVTFKKLIEPYSTVNIELVSKRFSATETTLISHGWWENDILTDILTPFIPDQLNTLKAKIFYLLVQIYYVALKLDEIDFATFFNPISQNDKPTIIRALAIINKIESIKVEFPFLQLDFMRCLLKKEETKLLLKSQRIYLENQSMNTDAFFSVFLNYYKTKISMEHYPLLSLIEVNFREEYIKQVLSSEKINDFDYQEQKIQPKNRAIFRELNESGALVPMLTALHRFKPSCLQVETHNYVENSKLIPYETLRTFPDSFNLGKGKVSTFFLQKPTLLPKMPSKTKTMWLNFTSHAVNLPSELVIQFSQGEALHLIPQVLSQYREGVHLVLLHENDRTEVFAFGLMLGLMAVKASQVVSTRDCVNDVVSVIGLLDDVAYDNALKLSKIWLDITYSTADTFLIEAAFEADLVQYFEKIKLLHVEGKKEQSLYSQKYQEIVALPLSREEKTLKLEDLAKEKPASQEDYILSCFQLLATLPYRPAMDYLIATKSRKNEVLLPFIAAVFIPKFEILSLQAKSVNSKLSAYHANESEWKICLWYLSSYLMKNLEVKKEITIVDIVANAQMEALQIDLFKKFNFFAEYLYQNAKYIYENNQNEPRIQSQAILYIGLAFISADRKLKQIICDWVIAKCGAGKKGELLDLRNRARLVLAIFDFENENKKLPAYETQAINRSHFIPQPHKREPIPTPPGPELVTYLTF